MAYKNYGFDIDRQRREEDPERDYRFGAIVLSGVADKVAGIVTALFAWPQQVNGVYPRSNNPINHCIVFFQKIWEKYFPSGEIQNDTQEKMDCVTRGHINELEKQFDYIIQNNLISSENLKWLKDGGYFNKTTGRIDFSNRIPAIMSGTTASGNSLKAPIQWISNNGLYPKSVLNELGLTFSQYYKKSDITQKMLDIGLEFLKRFTINYVLVDKKDFGNFSGGIKWEIFDNYIDTWDGDYVKRLAENYIFYPSGYQLIINEIKQEEKNMIIQIEVTKKTNSPAYLVKDKRKEDSWIRFGDEDTFHAIVGDFSQIKEETDIPDGKIGSPLYLATSFWKVISLKLLDFFSQLKGKAK